MKTIDFKPGTISVMQVYHDIWCKSNTKKGCKPSLCNCNTVTKIVETDSTKESVGAALGVKPENMA